MEGRFLLDVIILESSAVLELLTGEDKSLLIWGNSFLVLDLGLHVLNGVRLLNVESDGLSSEGLNEDLHTSSKSEDQVESRLLLDVVVLKGAAVFELLSGEDESLLVWGNTFFVLDLSLDVFDGVRLFDIKGDGLSGEGLDEDLHTTSESEDEMESGFLLNVVVLESTSILKLLSGEDESLLVWGDSFLILNLGLDVLNGVGLFNIEGDGLTSEGLDEDLHTTSESQHKMEGGLLLDVVVREGSSVLELLTGEDESLLVWWDTFLVLDLGLDIFDGVGWLDVEGDGLSGQSLDENLHTTSKSEDEMESGLLLDVVVGEGSAVLELLSSEDESLLIWRNTFLVLDLSLDILDGVSWLDVQGDGLSGKGLDEDLHLCKC